MKKANFLILSILFGCLLNQETQAAGLDEIYRDLVRSDNRGYLPLFVKNRQAPKIFDDAGALEEISRPAAIDDQDFKSVEDINLENERRRRSEEAEAAEQRWQQSLKNIQAGYVSSIELEELDIRERANNPQAIEVLAWIYARGIGVEVDLIKAFNFYRRGTALGIPQAKENAIKVYKAMTPEQKAQLLD